FTRFLTDYTIPEPLVEPCYVGDLECLKRSTELFLRQTYNGIPALNILPIDPIYIPALDVPFQGDNLVYFNKNIIVTGLRHQTLERLKMDLSTGSVVLTTSADVNVEGDINQVSRNLGRSAAGHFWTHGRVLATSSYSYTLQRDAMGVEHYVVGPETNSCQLIGTPTVSFSCNDASCPEEVKQLWKTNFCKIVEKAYATVVHNIRAAAEVLPATAFFKNPHGK
ncbi:juvenile hormone-binding protein-like, partial [Cydia amplana]|uniref:juvenile hormone-binding protein-like n=1 Tax=Cydia amplana TaxID=1869771 RepID=UPI002FE64E63